MLDRREFVRLSGLSALTLATGCDGEALPRLLAPWLGEESEDGPFAPPTAAEIDPVSHVLSRIAFGARPADHARVRALGRDPFDAARTYLAGQLDPDRLVDRRAERAVRRLESVHAHPGELFEYKPAFLLRQLAGATLLRAVYSERQLHERMVAFWSDHFNIDSSKGDCRWLKAADDRLVVRAHALGRFPDLLRASATSPAMLWYLDGRVNRRASPDERPNENYARELLELHTLGVDGGYTQHDVMEVARCLTGWTVRSEQAFGKGQVDFRAELHDDGEKEVLGHRIAAGYGARDLDIVLQIVALHPATARHVATKLCRRFIADDPPADAVRTVARAFLGSAGDIRVTLRTLFDAPEFWASRGGKLKRPFEYIVSALRATAAVSDGGPALDAYLTRMGHAPHQYPTPEGYADEATPWLGTLLWRWSFAVELARGRIAGTRLSLDSLRGAAGGEAGLMAHFLGRRPREPETRAYQAVGGGAMGLALLLSSPAFQRA